MRYDQEAVKWSGRHIEKLQRHGLITAPKVTYFHSMRHALINNLKQAQVEEALRAALVGHEAGGINETRYGKQYAAQILGDTLVSKLPEYATLLTRK